MNVAIVGKKLKFISGAATQARWSREPMMQSAIKFDIQNEKLERKFKAGTICMI